MNLYLRRGCLYRSTIHRHVVTAFLVSIVWGTGIASLRGERLVINGRNLCGYIWILQGLLATLAVLVSNRDRTSRGFPILVWVPWLAYIALRCDWTDSDTVQRTVMLMVGPLVAVASSRIVATKQELLWLLRSLIVLTLFLSSLAMLEVLNIFGSGLRYQREAAGMTIILLACYFAPKVYTFARKFTVLWTLCVLSCALTGMRTATAVCLATLPLSPSPQKPRKRLAMILLCCGFGVVTLSLPMIQRKMTLSGDASVKEILEGNITIESHGRFGYWPLFLAEAFNKPLFGHGGESSGRFGRELNINPSEELTHPHNDYIRIFFEYGVVGLLLFWCPIVYTIFYTYLRIRTTNTPVLKDAWTIACAGFISMCLLAITDNVILYIAFFGNLLFAILGAAHGVRCCRENGTWQTRSFQS